MQAAATSELATPPSSAPTPDSARWLKIAITACLLGCIYSGTVAGLFVDWWTEPAWSQGLLIVPLAAYLIWLRRPALLREPGIPSVKGLLLTAFACLLYLLGKWGAEDFLERISLVALLSSLVWTFWGFRRLKTVAFPLLLLAAAIPLPVLIYNRLTIPLQLFASKMSTDLAQMLGVSLYRDGNVINLAHISLGVEEACSGLNSLEALFVASLLIGFLFCSRFFPRLLLVLLAPPLAIGANILRITGTALLADYKEDLAMGFYHAFAGWLVFLVATGALFAVAKLSNTLCKPRPSR